MKKLIAIAAIVCMFAACTPTQAPPSATPDSIAIVINGDTIGVNQQTNKAFLLVHAKYDSLKRANDTFRTALFRAKFKLLRVWYYDSLCMRHPNNDKYLKGWIRALYQ